MTQYKNMFGVKLVNNRKENGRRPVRKQYAPLYTEKELDEMKKAVDDNGKPVYPTYYILQCSRRKKLHIHGK